MTTRLQFKGRVVPEISNLTIENHPTFRWQENEADFSMLIELKVEGSEITVSCELDEPYERSKHFDIAHMRATDIAMAAVNLAAYGLGLGVFVVIDAFIDPDGHETQLLYRDRELAALAPIANPDSASFESALDIVYKDIRMFNVLRDLIRANSVPSAVPASCGNAVEAIRSILAPTSTDRRAQWQQMRSNLNVTKDYLNLITDHAQAARHGEHPYVEGKITKEIAHRAWTLLNRYFEFRIRGSKPLPISEFPVLSG